MTQGDIQPLSIVIPAYNEENAIAETVNDICKTMDETGVDYELLIVNDGSSDGTSGELAQIGHEKLRIIEHEINRGYGASLKTGVRAAQFDLIVITDADGTYPNERIPELASLLGDRDMIVGSRKGKRVKIPLIRRPAKWFIGQLASYLARYKIPDINSGLRVFKKETLLRYLHLLPDGFSFTTTITLAMLTNGHKVKYEPINYETRIGKSKIKPIRDTLNFIILIIRTVLLFEPLRIFIPLVLVMLLAAGSIFGYCYFFTNYILDATITGLVIGAVQLLGVGMLADMFNRRMRY